MSKFLLLCGLLLSQLAFANMHLSPPNFNTPSGRRAVFIDISTAHYKVTYNWSRLRADVETEIKFKTTETGFPVFDLIPVPNRVELDGLVVGNRLVPLPGSESQVRIADMAVAAGEHTLKIKHRMKKNVKWRLRGFSSAWWIRDLKARKFIEQYVPTNLEYDQYAMTLDVHFIGKKSFNQEIYTNGKVSEIGKNAWRIQFPAYYTASSPYFHTVPKGTFRRKDFTYKSIDGRELPITVYSFWPWRVPKFEKEVNRVMAELEADYGPWGHDGLVAYGAGRGGMEHAGATMTSFLALDHEMLHSYFAKGVMPADGNSGWMDEAIASWRDKGYKRLPSMNFTGSNLSGHSVYTRNTDTRSYALGAEFMGHLDWILQDRGGLKAFLRGYFAAYKHTLVTTEHFKNNLSFWAGEDFGPLFDQYIFGKGKLDHTSRVSGENPYHPEVSDSELESLL